METEFTLMFSVFIPSAIALGAAAMTSEGWRRIVFVLAALVCGVLGVAWTSIKSGIERISPSVGEWASNFLGGEHTNTVLLVWFVLVIPVMTGLFITGKIKQAGSERFTVKKEAALADTLRNIDRTCFLLAENAKAIWQIEMLEDELGKLPQLVTDAKDDETMHAATQEISEYLRKLEIRLSGTRWHGDFRRINMSIEQGHEVKASDTPKGADPYKYKAYQITIVQRQHIEDFLVRSIGDARDHYHQIMRMVCERPDIHKG
ncbi:hypothetical protein [Roseibium aggregatum]|uniref:Uncharacterized protein n=1 Tax=Roseibium aggregatum TaxID=187304 RepID=A0A926NRB3_9HYPH|nr:hypothetical protein [Roseibium aggregatum]MBD1545922.1 hypothetical protein [Roseibium aggregatum]